MGIKRYNPPAMPAQTIPNVQGMNAAANDFFSSPKIYVNLVRGSGISWKVANSNVTITGISVSGTVATFTHSYNAYFAAGQAVSIAGVNPVQFNGNFAIASVISGTQFTIDYASSPGTYISGGTATNTAYAVQYGASVSSMSDAVSTFQGYVTDFGIDIPQGAMSISWQGTCSLAVTWPTTISSVNSSQTTAFYANGSSSFSNAYYSFSSVNNNGVITNTLTLNNYSSPTMAYPNGLINSYYGTEQAGLMTLWIQDGSLTDLEVIPSVWQSQWNSWKAYLATPGNPPYQVNNVSVHPFNPNFVQYLASLNVPFYRHMQDLDIGGRYSVLWANRPSLTTSIEPQTFNGSVIPLEDIISLANITGINPWVSLPMQAENAYYTNALQLLNAGLKPALTPIIEVSNEIWNPGSAYAQSQNYAIMYTCPRQTGTIDTTVWSGGALSLTSGSNSVSFTGAIPPANGMLISTSATSYVAPSALPANTYVTNVTGSSGAYTLTLSANATSTASPNVFGINTYFTVPGHGYTTSGTLAGGGTPLATNTVETNYLNGVTLGYPLSTYVPYWNVSAGTLQTPVFVMQVVDANTVQLAIAGTTNGSYTMVHAGNISFKYSGQGPSGTAVNPTAVQCYFYTLTVGGAYNSLTWNASGYYTMSGITPANCNMQESWQIGTGKIIGNAFTQLDAAGVHRTAYRKTVGYQFENGPTTLPAVLSNMGSQASDVDFVHGAPYFYLNHFGVELVPSINGTLAIRGFSDFTQTLNFSVYPAGTVISAQQVIQGLTQLATATGNVSVTSGATSSFQSKTSTKTTVTGGSVRGSYVSGLTAGNSYDIYVWSAGGVGSWVPIFGLQKYTVAMPTSANILTISTLTGAAVTTAGSLTFTGGTAFAGNQVGGLAVSPLQIISSSGSTYTLDGTLTAAVSGQSLPVYALSSFTASISGNTLTVTGSVTGVPLAVGMGILSPYLQGTTIATGETIYSITGFSSSANGQYIDAFITAVLGGGQYTISINVGSNTIPSSTMYSDRYYSVSSQSQISAFCDSTFNDFYNSVIALNSYITSPAVYGSRISQIGYEGAINSYNGLPLFPVIQNSYAGVIASGSIYESIHQDWMKALGQGGFTTTCYFATTGHQTTFSTGSDLVNLDDRYTAVAAQNSVAGYTRVTPYTITNDYIYSSPTYPLTITALPTSDSAGAAYTHTVIAGNDNANFSITGGNLVLNNATDGASGYPNQYRAVVKSASKNINVLTGIVSYISSSWYEPDSSLIWDSKVNNGVLPTVAISPLVGVYAPLKTGTGAASVPSNGWWEMNTSQEYYASSSPYSVNLASGVPWVWMAAVKFASGAISSGLYSTLIGNTGASFSVSMNGTANSVSIKTFDVNYNIASASWASGVATISTTTANTFETGQSITIGSVSPSGYNGTYTITVVNPTTFTYSLASNPGTYVSGGTASSQPVAVLPAGAISDANANGVVVFVYYDGIGNLSFGYATTAGATTIATDPHVWVSTNTVMNMIYGSDTTIAYYIGCTQFLQRGNNANLGALTLAQASAYAVSMASYLGT